MLAFLRVSAVLGLIVFLPVLLAATLAPQYVERAARDFAVSKVRGQVDQHLESPAGRALQATYKALVKKYAKEKKAAEAKLATGFAERVSKFMAKLCNLDCNKKERLKASIEDGLKAQIARLDKSIATLKALAQRKFNEITGKIRRDLIIFSGSNSFIFAMMLALTFARRDYAHALFVPSLLMLASTIAAILIYVFGQNWFFTILTGSYTGFGYLAYIGVIFFFLCDVVLNRARVMLGIMTSLDIEISPC